MAGENRKDDRYTWPGGLGAISKHLVEILQAKTCRSHADRRDHRCRIEEKNAVQCHLHAGHRVEDGLREGRHHGNSKFITRRIVEGFRKSKTMPCSRCATSRTRL